MAPLNLFCSLKARLVLPNLIGIVTLILLAFALWLPSISNQQARNLVHEQYKLLQAMSPAIGHHIETHNMTQITYLLDKYLRINQHEWKSIRLVDRSGKLLYPHNTAVSEPADDAVMITYPVFDINEHQLALLALDFDLPTVLASTMMPYYQIALTIILVVVLVTLGIIWFQNKWIKKPIDNLDRAIGELANGNFDVEIEQHQTGEIQKLIDNFIDMRDQLGKSQAELLKNLENIRDAEIQYETIVKTVYDPLITSDDKGVIVSANDAATWLFGYSLEELIGSRINMLMPSSEAEHHDQYLYNHVHTGKVRVVDSERQLIAKRKDGSEFPIDLALSSMDLSGKRYFNALIRDITERVATEQQLIEEKLRADASNRAKSAFLSRVSHELHTPLNAILGFGQLLNEEANDSFTEEQRDNLREIIQAGEHLHALIGEIISLADSEEIAATEDDAFVNCNELLLMTKEQTADMASEKQIKLSINIDPECENLIVAMNYEKLSSVLVELMTNGIKFNHPGGQLRVDCRYIADENIRFSITNSGPGLNEEESAKLFQPFERLGAEYTAIPGSGFGLVRCQNILKSVGTELHVDCSEGQGCTFWFEVTPVRKSSARENHSLAV